MSPLTWRSSCVRFEKHRSYFHACCATFACSHETPCCCHWCPWLCCLLQFDSVVCARKIYATLPRVLMARGNNDRLGDSLSKQDRPAMNDCFCDWWSDFSPCWCDCLERKNQRTRRNQPLTRCPFWATWLSVSEKVHLTIQVHHPWHHLLCRRLHRWPRYDTL